MLEWSYFSKLLFLLQNLNFINPIRKKNLEKKDDILDRRCTSQLCAEGEGRRGGEGQVRYNLWLWYGAEQRGRGE